VPARGLVIAVTAALSGGGETLLGPLWECLLPGLDDPDPDPAADAALADRLRRLGLAPVTGTAGGGEAVTARVDVSVEGSALPDGTLVTVEPDRRDDAGGQGWLVPLGLGPAQD